MNPLVSIIIINYNGKKFLPDLFKSVFSQTYKNTEIIFVDNASLDNPGSFIKKKHQSIKTIFNKNNLGYAGAANQGIKESQGKYILILNPDIFLKEDFIEKLIKRAEKDQNIGAVSGKMLSWSFTNKEKTDIIDSTGILAKKSGFFLDRGQGEKDEDQYKSGEVFGVSGAAMFLRKKALEDIKIFNEYFDNDFFAYKEDVDVSWRLRLLGWKCFFEEKAVLWHCRSLGKKETHLLSKIYSRREFSLKAKKLSYRNHYLLLLKNMFFQNMASPSFFIPFLWFEFKKLFYVILLEPYLLLEDFKIAALLPKILKKRKETMKNKKAKSEEINKWFS